MRVTAILIALAALCVVPSWAVADPFDRLSDRVQRYDEQMHGTSQRGSRVRHAAHAEVVEPQPVPDPQAEQMDPGQGNWEGSMDGEYYDGDYGYGGGGGCCDDGCCDMGCNSCNSCLGCLGIPRGFWGRAEYLYWWAKGSQVPALVTTSPSGTPLASAGVLPAADILFGNQFINTRGRPGGRFTFGYWFDPCYTLGIENTFFFLGDLNQGYNTASAGTPILARPFFNTNPTSGSPHQDSIVVAFPSDPQITGTVNITTSSQIFSNELNVRRALYVDPCRRIDLIAGWRYFNLNEQLNISSSQSNITEGFTISPTDQFSARSQFNGAQLGIDYQITRGCFSVDLLGKIALGGMNQRIQINGTQTRTAGTQTSTLPFGMLALPSNIGTFQDTDFSVIPEFDLNLRYQLTPLWTVNLGYTIIGVTNVVRPGDQIDAAVINGALVPKINPNQFDGGSGSTPHFQFNASDMWIQGINFGVECNF